MHIPCYKPWNSGSKHNCQYKPRLLSSSPTRGPNLTQLVKNRTTTSGKELKPSSSSKVVKRSVVRRLSGEIEPLPCRWTFFWWTQLGWRLIHLPTFKYIHIIQLYILHTTYGLKNILTSYRSPLNKHFIHALNFRWNKF